MRQEKRLKRWMKEYLSERGLKVDNWRYLTFSHEEEELVIIHKHSLQPKKVKLGKDSKRKRHANEFMRTSLANSGRIAGIGISYDDYSDNFDIAMENTDYFPNPKFGAPPLSEEEKRFRDEGGPVKIYKLKEERNG